MKFSLVLLDAQMPGMDGYETAHAINKVERLPIIFVTAIDRDIAHAKKAYDAGAIDFIYKPFAPAILNKKIESLLRIWNR